MSLSVEDKLAIHEMFSRWAYAYDERELDMLRACFSSEANFSMRIAGGDLIGPFEGVDAIMGLMTGAMEEQTDVRRHLISNIFFTQESGNPEVTSNLTLLATENDEIKLLSAGIYRDVLVKEGDTWRILSRHLELDKAY